MEPQYEAAHLHVAAIAWEKFFDELFSYPQLSTGSGNLATVSTKKRPVAFSS